MRKNEILTAFFIARKNLARNKSSLLFTILIISLGFISSIIIYGVLQDVRYVLQENYIETSVGHVVLEPYGNNDKIENVDNALRKVKSLPNVLGTSKITRRFARFYDDDGNYIDTEIYIVNPEEFSRVSVVDELISEGSWLNKGREDSILMGCVNIKSCNEVKTFDTIDLDVGEKTLLVSNGGTEAQLTLQGIYDHRYFETEMISYMNEETAEKMFQDYDSTEADQVVLLLSDRSYTEEIIEELSRMSLNVKISEWEEKSSKLASIVDSFTIIGDLSFLIGVIISAISIYIILYINILNKRTQIGIIKAIGIKSRVVALSYVMLSFFLGIVGSVLGVLLTLSMTAWFKLYPIQTGVGDLVPQITVKVFLLVGISIILASAISGYVVSRRITKQNIIEAIFYG